MNRAESRAAFVERFASVLTESGFPRMPARVFAALLATDAGRLTAAQLAEMLHVSAAAISGAVRYLVQVNLASREAAPGSRREHYRVHSETWYEAIARRIKCSIDASAVCATASTSWDATRLPARASPRRLRSSSSCRRNCPRCSSDGARAKPSFPWRMRSDREEATRREL